MGTYEGISEPLQRHPKGFNPEPFSDLLRSFVSVRQFLSKNFLEAGDRRSPVLHTLCRLTLKHGNGVREAEGEGLKVVGLAHAVIVSDIPFDCNPLSH